MEGRGKDGIPHVNGGSGAARVEHWQRKLSGPYNPTPFHQHTLNVAREATRISENVMELEVPVGVPGGPVTFALSCPALPQLLLEAIRMIRLAAERLLPATEGIVK